MVKIIGNKGETLRLPRIPFKRVQLQFLIGPPLYYRPDNITSETGIVGLVHDEIVPSQANLT